tara:strand:+ start:157 stop:363 length:207 start_codon:yes stop_codon:yes gene_type:complete
MGSLIKILLLDELSCIVLFSFIKIGVMHIASEYGVKRGFFIALWRFEIDINFCFNKLYKFRDRQVGNA